MNEIGIVGLVILAVTFLVSYKGFKDSIYFDQHLFRIGDILHRKEYQRLISSGFLHAGWTHLLLNAATFYCFSGSIEEYLGFKNFLTIYFLSLVGGNLLSLFLHRHESGYTAVGASGAIAGLVFATIALYPGVEISLLALPYHIPGWLFGLLYVIISAYGISVKRDYIGHDAHLGGGLVGLVTTVALQPELLRTNYLAIGAILLPACAFLYLLLKEPVTDSASTRFSPLPLYQSVDDRYTSERRKREEELDELLDKISHKGLEGLSTREKKELEELSR
ncbi:rhomboid family intramembrane serine protease [Hymenobacter sp. GOD-10R]|uniref:rhomboid family intramembrane serine protease n=1 Tax=Hymenobacter sp. GOD-10R TaxID=3093922 RepID=UPI002D79163D|nr:rhomboid family intramembrane serine protease [Hymenobacter sp. GOD-10R]WRQ26399.1 rhomboid family intramembrane serine protease [Hymenobacter sp. GOD-10R]